MKGWKTNKETIREVAEYQNVNEKIGEEKKKTNADAVVSVKYSTVDIQSCWQKNNLNKWKIEYCPRAYTTTNIVGQIQQLLPS